MAGGGQERVQRRNGSAALGRHKKHYEVHPSLAWAARLAKRQCDKGAGPRRGRQPVVFPPPRLSVPLAPWERLLVTGVWHLLQTDELASLRVGDVVFVTVEGRPTAALRVAKSKTDQAGHGTVVARACAALPGLLLEGAVGGQGGPTGQGTLGRKAGGPTLAWRLWAAAHHGPDLRPRRGLRRWSRLYGSHSLSFTQAWRRPTRWLRPRPDEPRRRRLRWTWSPHHRTARRWPLERRRCWFSTGSPASSTSPRQSRVPLTPGLPVVAGSGLRPDWPGSSARANAAAPVFARERLTGAWMHAIRNAEKEKELPGTRVE